MKRIITNISVFLALFFVFTAASCTAYTPKRDDFEFLVELEKTQLTQGESLEYNVKVTRISGKAFRFTGSSTLCGVYFESSEKAAEPTFVRNDDIVTYSISESYKYEKSDNIATEHYEPGEYLFAVRFFMGELQFDFGQKITIHGG